MGILATTRLSARRVSRTRPLKLVLLLVIVATLLETLHIQLRIASRDRHPPAFDSPRKHERVYISALHWNSAVLLRNQWNPAVLSLVDALGHGNVFVSVYESGSWDDTKSALAELDVELATRAVERNIEVSNVTHQDEIEEQTPADGEPLPEGWIETSRSPAEMRRIPFLARLRNRTLKDLWRLSDQGITFDKIVFLNDVVFSAADVLTLLDTNRGIYAAACSLDFADPPLFYDTFALRDDAGDPHLTSTWPYFASASSREAVVAHSSAVPVKSCWNGIVAMPAAPFSSSARDQRLTFRGIPDSLASMHLEGSECCLVHVDNPLSKDLGVYLNPRVRVGYNPKAYSLTHAGIGLSWVGTWGVWRGIWLHRLLEWLGTGKWFKAERAVVDERFARWEAESSENHEPGKDCLIDEQHVVVWNGWNHV